MLHLAGISTAEARAIMDYWAASGLLTSEVTESAVTERWTVAGNGILGEMERASLTNMRL